MKNLILLFAIIAIGIITFEGSKAHVAIADMQRLPSCWVDGAVVVIQVDGNLPAEGAGALPQAIQFPLEVIPEAKALGIKGNVQFSFAALQRLGATCNEYERLRSK